MKSVRSSLLVATIQNKQTNKQNKPVWVSEEAEGKHAERVEGVRSFSSNRPIDVWVEAGSEFHEQIWNFATEFFPPELIISWDINTRGKDLGWGKEFSFFRMEFSQDDNEVWVSESGNWRPSIFIIRKQENELHSLESSLVSWKRNLVISAYSRTLFPT